MSARPDEVHMFSGNGAAMEGNGLYAVGERHELLVFLRQPPGDHDYERARRALLEAGWNEVNFDRASSVAADLTAVGDATLREAILHAADGNPSVLVYGVLQKRGESPPQ